MRQLYKPSFKRPGEEIDIKVKSEIDKIRTEFDNRVRTEVEEKIKVILKEKEESEKKEKAEKLKQAVDAAKAIKGDKGEKGDSDKDILNCPTCHTAGRDGHMHKLDTDKSGLVWKCHGDKCGFEAVFVPKNSDYKCVGCGLPIKKPDKDELIKDMSCPFCHGTKSIKHDWSKLWGVKR